MTKALTKQLKVARAAVKRPDLWYTRMGIRNAGSSLSSERSDSIRAQVRLYKR